MAQPQEYKRYDVVLYHGILWYIQEVVMSDLAVLISPYAVNPREPQSIPLVDLKPAEIHQSILVMLSLYVRNPIDAIRIGKANGCMDEFFRWVDPQLLSMHLQALKDFVGNGVRSDDDPELINMVVLMLESLS